MSINDIAGFNEIKELSEASQTKIFAKPEQSEALINTVALEVLNRMPKQQADCSDVVKFLHKVIYLDSKYYDQFKTHPFQTIIEKLQAALIHLKPTAEKLQIEILAKLKDLDLDSPKLKTQIAELTALVERLEGVNGITPFQKVQFLRALKAIEPGYFKPSVYECQAWEFISEKCPAFKTALEAVEPFFKGEESEGRKNMLKHLQQPNCSLAEIADTCTKTRIAITKHLVTCRLDHIIARVQEKEYFSNPNFALNFLYLIQTIKKFALKIAHPIFVDNWEILLRIIDPDNNGQFMALLRNYPQLCPEDFIPKFVIRTQAHFLKPLTLELLCHHNHASFKEKIVEMNKKAPDKLSSYFAKAYKEYFLYPHNWIACNINAIVKPYDQSADIHRNQSLGTCYQNSLDRHVVLLGDPQEDAAAISMGSSASGRATQASLVQTFVGAKKGLLPKTEAVDRQIESSKRVGLVRTPNEISSSDTPEKLVRSIDACQEHHDECLWILALTSPEGGHAINIQITQKLGIFRFIDDNLGVCQWVAYKQFHDQFLAYLKAFYPEYVKFVLETYSKIQ